VRHNQKRYEWGTLLLVLFLLVSCCSVFVSGDEPPPIPEPKALTLTANPVSIYLGGDTSIITATVYNDTNCTEPIPNIGVYFNTSLGGITYLGSSGVNIAPTVCWATTNESGVARALLTAGFTLGTAQIFAWTGGERVITRSTAVVFLQPVYGVILLPDSETKAVESNENATYALEVRNIGTGTDSYALNITATTAEHAALNKSVVNLTGGKNETVALTVSSYLAGNYTTTVEAVSAHARANVTVTTEVKSFYNLTAAVAPAEPQIVAPGVNAQYTVTVRNTGNAPDRFNITMGAPLGVSATVNRSVTELLDPEESEPIELTVSSAWEGEHVVNLTITSEGNSSVNATLRIETVVTRTSFELDTGKGAYPSIAGVHRGVIIPNHTVVVKRLYTYPAAGTGGHAEAVRIYNTTWSVNATWEGYRGDYHTLTFSERFTLIAGEAYGYEIHTGSYPQLIHQQNCTTLDGSYINCSSFEAVNGAEYGAVIPAVRLSP
jgi:hypothetical protein